MNFLHTIQSPTPQGDAPQSSCGDLAAWTATCDTEKMSIVRLGERARTWRPG